MHGLDLSSAAKCCDLKAVTLVFATELDRFPIGFLDQCLSDDLTFPNQAIIIIDLIVEAVIDLGFRVDLEALWSDMFGGKTFDIDVFVAGRIGIVFELSETGIDRALLQAFYLLRRLLPFIDLYDLLPMLEGRSSGGGSGDENCCRGQCNGGNCWFDQSLEHGATILGKMEHPLISVL